ncbi:nudC domain-containing protein 1-like [Actinia tenebrosa]|uniref:NudC domain-containing protein 1 n=1 Tax=Actinia tenebrosa TaxID=6105 RepID=A0A6P8I5Q9_ACTTE|nr:nudC domain-containing protein 1-like [Actinia tenebrosa]
MATESLNPDSSLLNPKFEGYKLSADPVEVSSTNLVSDVKVVNQRDDLFSLQYIRAFGSHNHLTIDPWQDSTLCERVYFVDENNEVQQATVKGNTIDTLESVFKIPLTEECKERLNTSISFPSKEFVCVGDGCGKLYIIHSEGRTKCGSTEWKTSFVYEFEEPFEISHAIQDAETGTLSCLMLSMIEKDDEILAKKAHIVKLSLGVFSQLMSSGSSSFTCEAIKHIQGQSAPLYAVIEPGNKAVIVACEKTFHLLKDNNNSSSQNNEKTEIQEKEQSDEKGKNGEDNEDEEEQPTYTYTWFQEGDEVTVSFELAEGTTKDDVVCVIKPDEIELSLFSGETLLKGPLFAKVKAGESTWTLSKNSLEIVLEKQSTEHHWSSVVAGDTKGKYILQGEEAKRVQEIHERLEHLTSDKLVSSDKAERLLFNQQQLEDCDEFPEDIEYIMRLDINTGTITHKVCLAGHQWVFNTTLSPGSLPVFCLRHDVDALVWQPKTNLDDPNKYWSHIGTFDALGYVQASKEDRRFSTCAPNMKYAVITDSTKHVYIYNRPENGAKVSIQKVVTLESPSNSILGLQASNKRIFVLTSKSLHVILAKS